MNNSELIEIFFEIDANHNGVVTKKELISYLNKRDHTAKTIEALMDIFEESEDVITFQDYCLRLGEDIENYDYPQQHESDVEIINSKMNNFHREWIVTNIVRRAELKCKDNKGVAEFIKKALDKQMDPLWHCLIVKGQYWAFYSHEPENSIVLKYKSKIYILFRTPGY